MAATIFVLTRNAGLVLHPIDPIGTSGNAGIIGAYVLLLGLCALFARASGARPALLAAAT